MSGRTGQLRLETVTADLMARAEPALVPFFTAGYPNDATFLDLVDTAVSAGCAVVEVGVPFSDPMADGPVIQESSRVALQNGMTLTRALELVAEIQRRSPVEVVLMGYLNPLLRMGVGRFAELAGAAGAGGVIVPDLPVEEAHDVRRTLEGEGLCLVDLVAPTSTEARLSAIADAARGFLYLVSLTGVTGVRSQLSESLAAYVQRVRAVCAAPLYVGFGVSTPEHAAAVARSADGAVMGSALIRIVQETQDTAEAVRRVGDHLTACRAAMLEAASAGTVTVVETEEEVRP